MRTFAGLLGMFVMAVAAWADPGSGVIAGSGVEIATRPVRIELTTKGYKVYLTKPAVDRFRVALAGVGNGGNLADLLKELSKSELLDEESQLRLDLTAWAVRSQLPSFKEALDKYPNENGAIITVFGVQREPMKDRPILRRIAKGVMQSLPSDIEEKARKALVIARTDVLFWTVEGR